MPPSALYHLRPIPTLRTSLRIGTTNHRYLVESLIRTCLKAEYVYYTCRDQIFIDDRDV